MAGNKGGSGGKPGTPPGGNQGGPGGKPGGGQNPTHGTGPQPKKK